MCNVSVGKHGPVCVGPAVQLCGMAGGDFVQLSTLHSCLLYCPAEGFLALAREPVGFEHVV